VEGGGGYTGAKERKLEERTNGTEEEETQHVLEATPQTTLEKKKRWRRKGDLLAGNGNDGCNLKRVGGRGKAGHFVLLPARLARI